MTPKKTENHLQIFQSRLDNQLNMRHKLVILSQQIDWSAFEKEFGALYVPEQGRPGLPIRLLAGLTYLSRTCNFSDEAAGAEWLENPYWQYFCGHEYFQIQLPLDSVSLVRWRRRFSASELRWRKRWAAIEPVIGHLKSDHRMDRNYLKGELGDKMNAMLAGCGRNLRKLLKILLGPFFQVCFCGLSSAIFCQRTKYSAILK